MLKKSLVIGFGVVMACVCHRGFAADDRGPLIVISAHFLLLTDTETVIEDAKGRGIRVGSHSLELGEEILWDGSPEWPEDDPSLTLISSPRVSTIQGKQAIIRAGLAGVPHYFEKADGDSYRLRTVRNEERPRIELSVTPFLAGNDAEGKPQVDAEFSIDIVLISHRIDLPGVPFDVGKPIIRNRNITSMMRMRVGDWEPINIHLAKGIDGATQDEFVILMKIDVNP